MNDVWIPDLTMQLHCRPSGMTEELGKPMFYPPDRQKSYPRPLGLAVYFSPCPLNGLFKGPSFEKERNGLVWECGVTVRLPGRIFWRDCRKQLRSRFMMPAMTVEGGCSHDPGTQGKSPVAT